MKITRLPIPDILQLLVMVSVEVDEDDEADTDLVGGVYAQDSSGGIWKQDRALTGLLMELQPEGPDLRRSHVKAK